MKKWFFVPILCLFLVVCLKPERDNPNDEYYSGSNKAYLEGTTYNFDDTPFKGVKIGLFLDDTIAQEISSDENGWYEFENVDPGIYKIKADIPFYRFQEAFPETIQAGDSIVGYDAYFNWFDFEDVPTGPANIPKWTVQAGRWDIVIDNTASMFHTVPNVYKGEIPTMSVAYCLTVPEFSNFRYQVLMKSEENNPSNWQMGIFFRYADSANYYRLRLSDQPTTIALNKVVGGNNTTLYSNDPFIGKNIWYKLSIECIDDIIRFRLSNAQNEIINEEIPDTIGSIIERGQLGILLIHPVTIHFDDIIIEKIE